jgi:glycosyltransferase involved in cell wall biosynthesis/tetratricopeptide (TPR) repeat protein
LVVWRLRLLARWRSRAIASELFTAILVRASGRERALAALGSAMLRGARQAEKRSRWLEACQFWVWNAQATGDNAKPARNIIRCARNLTVGRSDPRSVASALEAWELLTIITPRSPEARQGIAWCHSALARWAEEAGDFATARAHWRAVLRANPNHEGASQGVRRTEAADSGSSPDRLGFPLSRSDRAYRLYETLTRTAKSDYHSQRTAGKLLLDAGAPDLAIGFLQKAVAQKPAPEAVILLFRCYVASARYHEAAGLLESLVRQRSLVGVPPETLHVLLTHVSPELLSSEMAAAIGTAFAQNSMVAPALLPPLVAHDLHAILLAAIDAIPPDTRDFDEAAVLSAVEYLTHRRQDEAALRLLALFSRTPAIAAAFSRLAGSCESDRLESAVMLGSKDDVRICTLYLALAEHHLRSGNADAAVAMLGDISKSHGRESAPFYRSQKDRLSNLIGELLRQAGSDAQIRSALAEFVVGWVREPVKTFFAGPEFAEMCERLSAASRFEHAAPSSRIGLFREHYFEHYLERRENQRLESLDNDFALADAALRYFATTSGLRGAELVPVPDVLRRRLAKPCLLLGGNAGAADVLMSYAILREQPDCDLKAAALFDDWAEWYLTEFMRGNPVPPNCISAGLLTHLNSVRQEHAAFGVVTTRFTDVLWKTSRADPEEDSPATALDVLLFTLASIRALALNPHYRPFIVAMALPAAPGQPSFFDVCVARLVGRQNGSLAVPLSRLIGGDIGGSEAAVPASGRAGAIRDVLVIGHEGEATGLSRNFAMLTETLRAQPDLAVQTLSYEADPKKFTEALRQWRASCRSIPVVIAAVNAQDVPTLFAKDRHGALEQCHVVGFFLWETSQLPPVQSLGVKLVDEIWAPTQYVADIYAPFATAHVVGKALFAGEDWPAPRPAAKTPIRFLTVFDFHSSIERKNPLAAVLAFQRAFAANEDVELVIKASNVNPQHPGNASGQWERLCAASAGDKRITIVEERYSEEQMRALISGSSCVVSLHRAEGFGYVLADAMAAGIPVIATAHSGNLDFCDNETSFFVGFRLVPVRSHGALWESEGACWAEPEIDSAAAQMRRVYEDYPAALEKAAAARSAILEKYSAEAFAATLRSRLAAICSERTGVDPAPLAVH